MRLAPLTNVTDDSRTMLCTGLATRRPVTSRTGTNDFPVIAALPATLYRIIVSSGTPGTDKPLGSYEASRRSAN